MLYTVNESGALLVKTHSFEPAKIHCQLHYLILGLLGSRVPSYKGGIIPKSDNAITTRQDSGHPGSCPQLHWIR